MSACPTCRLPRMPLDAIAAAVAIDDIDAAVQAGLDTACLCGRDDAADAPSLQALRAQRRRAAHWRARHVQRNARLATAAREETAPTATVATSLPAAAAAALARARQRAKPP